MSTTIQSKVVNSGKSSYELAIDTDGSSSNKYGDSTYQGQTSSGVAADIIPFVVVPGGHTYNFFGKSLSAFDLMGYMCSVKDPSTNRIVWGICGDVGPRSSVWREVSIKLAWMLGYKNVSGSVSAPARKYVITVYNKKLSTKGLTSAKIEDAAKSANLYSPVEYNVLKQFIALAEKQKGTDGTWTWSYSGVIAKPGPWCAGFITACAKKLNLLNKIFKGSAWAAGIPRDSVKAGYGKYLVGPSQGEYPIPQAGDLVNFRYQSRNFSDKYDCDHIEIVRSYNAKSQTFKTVGGNCGSRGSANNTVKFHEFGIKDKTVSGYYRPDWSKVGGYAGSEVSKYGKLFATETTREDAVVREVGYLDSKNQPSIKSSDIRLSIINYTSLLSDVFDVVRAVVTVKYDPDGDGDRDLTEIPSSSGYMSMLYPCPDKTTITCGFYGYSNHNGVDFGTGNQTGFKVRAVESGTVVVSEDITSPYAGYSGPHVGGYYSYGRYIVIKHDKPFDSAHRNQVAYTLYAHNKERLVSKGTVVKRGQQIAWSGDTGKTYGAHVHFGLSITNGDWRNGWVNPTNHFHSK